MKIKPLLTAGLLLLPLAAASLFGAEAPNVNSDPLPRTKGEFWTWIIAGVSPLIVTGVRCLVPKIPKLLLPVSTPLIGLGLGAALNALGAAELGWLDMAQAGALAVFIRETFDQGLKSMYPPDVDPKKPN